MDWRTAYNFSKRTVVKRIGIVAIVAICLIALFYFFEFRPPRYFPSKATISVSSGESLSEIADQLEKDNVIRSPFWFINFVILLRHEHAVVGGNYCFNMPLNVFEVAKRMVSGQFGMGQIKTTIPEGSNVSDIANLLKKNYPDFNTKGFIDMAKSKEGYLFPDTYYFGADVSPEDVVSSMTAGFQRKVINNSEVQNLVASSTHSLSDILKMASILEGEARKMRTRQIIAGILWNRIKLGMPLQVDVSLKYIDGKGSAELTKSDLKVDSPYNTYLYKGLPPTPISNPGIDSITAAATPISTNYLYFLAGNDDVVYYASTLAEHAANKQKYLGN